MSIGTGLKIAGLLILLGLTGTIVAGAVLAEAVSEAGTK